MGRIKRITTLAVLCGLLLLSILFQIISKSSAYFLSVFDKSGVNSVMVELIFDRLDFDDPDIAALDETYYDEKDGVEIPWGSKQNPYVISQKYHVQNLSVLQNSGFFAERTETDADGNEIPVQSYFLVCTPEGDPVAIDCDGMTIDPIGTKEQPFTGVIQGAPITGEASYKSYGVSVSTIANLTVNAKTDNPDVGFFGHAGYYGNYDPNTATLTDGYAATIENLLFADVTIKSTKSLTKTLAEWWDTLFPNHLHYLDKRAETHHVGIIAGHAEFATIKNVSVYYSEDVAAFNLVSDAEGSNTNYYSSTGLIGLLQYVNPAVNEDGSLDGSGGVSDSQITDGESGGGGEESGTLTGYFLAETLFNEHEEYIDIHKPTSVVKKDSYDVKEMHKTDTKSLFETVQMGEGPLGMRKVTYYYFRDSVFTFAMSMSENDTTGADYVEKIWTDLDDTESRKIYATDSIDKWKYVDDPESAPRISYRLTAVESAPSASGYYVLVYNDTNTGRYYALNISDTSKTYAYDITDSINTDDIDTPYYDDGSLKSVNIIGTNKTYYDYSFLYESSTYIITDPDPSTNYRFGITSTWKNNTHEPPNFHYGTNNQNASGTGWLFITYGTTAYLYNWNFSHVGNGKFSVSFRDIVHGVNASGNDIYYWAMLQFDKNNKAISLESEYNYTGTADLPDINASIDETNYFTLMQLNPNTVTNNNITDLGSGNKELTPKNLLPFDYDGIGNLIDNSSDNFDPATHVFEYDEETDAYKLAPIRSYRLNNGNGDLLTQLNHRLKLFKTVESNFSLNFGSNLPIYSDGGVVRANIGTSGTKFDIPTGMMAFDIREASKAAPSYINIIVAINPEQITKTSVGLWARGTGNNIVNQFNINEPDDKFDVPISKTATSGGDVEKSYMINVSARVTESKENGKTIYTTNKENLYVYLGGEVAFVYHSFEIIETGIYLVGSMAGPLSVSYFSVSGAAGAGSDGMTGSPLGMVDFVYDYKDGNKTNIITVDKLYTEDEQLLNKEDYTQYYPSFLFVSMLPEMTDGSLTKKINNEKVCIRRYIDGNDKSGTQRHIKMTGETHTSLRGVSEVFEDLQDDIDDDGTDSN